MIKSYPRKGHHRSFKSFTQFNSLIKNYSPVTQIAFAIGLTLLVFGLPLTYVLNKNYSAFISLAFQYEPSLIKQIEREQVWTNIFIATMSLSIIAINLYVMWKFVSRFSQSTKVLTNQFRDLSKGKWGDKDQALLDPANYDSLIAHYDYFLKSLQALTLSEIRQLEKLVVDPKNREAYAIWEQLLKAKRSRLGFEEIADENRIAAASIHQMRRSA